MAIRRIALDGDTVHLEAELVGKSAACPACQTITSRVHDRYVRRPIDLPWRGHRVRMNVTIRRFCCENPSCRRQTFAEDCGEQLPRYARRTCQVNQHLLRIVQIAGGEAGARLAATECLPVSPDTLLRLQRQTPLGPVSLPRVLGIDDLALRRGQTYATIFVDLETGRPIDLIESRNAESVAKWLKAHPGIEVISRDRGQDYAEGAKAGAPWAVQVADRFHLVQNASQALDGMMRGRRLSLDDEDNVEASEEAEVIDTVIDDPAEPVRPLSAAKRYQAERQAARLDRWERVQALAKAGASIQGIGREVGVSRKTVRRLIDSPIPPHNQNHHPRPGGLQSPTLKPYLEYLQDRWQAGCQNVAQLFREIAWRGYTGSRSLLSQSIQPWRGPRPPRAERGYLRRLTSRSSLRWLCLRPPDQLKPDERKLLDKLLARDAELLLGYRLLNRFREIVAKRERTQLDIWLSDAKASNLPTFISLAKGFESDQAAVGAALTYAWSNGPVEGQITKVKLIKRQGYGRANFDLLRIRVLAA